MQHNYLKLNLDKTQVVFFGRPADLKVFDVSLTVDDKTYNSKEKCTIETLGVVLDDKLSMEKFVSQSVKKCYFTLKNLQSIRHFLDQDVKLALVMSTILSRLDYCNILLSSTNKTIINKLQRVLNSCMRFIYNLKRTESVYECLKDSHILPVNYRVQYKCCVTIFKMINNLSPQYLQPLVSYSLPNRNLRSTDEVLKLQLPNTSLSILYNVIKNWNELPSDLRNKVDFNDFKKSLKTFYFRHAFSI